MTDQSDILSGESTEQQAAPQPQNTETTATAPQVDPNSYFADKLNSIVNEETGRPKYTSVDAALAGIPHAQDHIKNLELDNQELRMALEETRRVNEEVLSQVASMQQATVTAEPSLRKEDVYAVIKEMETVENYQSNRKSVVDSLVNYCNGDQVKAAEYISTKLNELGMSREEMALLSERSPAAAKRLFGVDGMGTPASKSSFDSSINSEALGTHVKREIPKANPLKVGATAKDFINEWRAAGEEVKHKLGID